MDFHEKHSFSIFNFQFSINCSFIQQFHETFLVRIGNGDIEFSEHDSVPFDGFNFVDIDDIGTVYPDEYVSGEMVLDTLHAHQRENTSLLVLGLDANVIF